MSQLIFRTGGTPDQFRRWTQRKLPGQWNSTSFLVGAAVVAGLVYVNSMRPVITLIQEAGVNVIQAKLAIDIARRTNVIGVLVPEEALDKANAIRAAAEDDPPGATTLVNNISFIEVGGRTSAVITNQIPGVTIHYTVSGTDGYYDSATRQTGPDGTVSFDIPKAEPSVLDSISVWAVLSGKIAKTTFVW